MNKPLKLISIILITAVILAASTVISAKAYAVWFNPEWGFRQVITINSSQVPGDLTNFPVLVSVTDPNLRQMPNGNVGRADGGDIAFTLSDGFTQLNHEIESYNPSTGQIIAWVQVPNVSSAADTILYMYYGNAGAADQWETDGSTWDSNFIMVQHLHETAGTHFDSTSNANDGSPMNGVTQNTTGQINGADDFDGSNDYVDVGTGAGITGDQVTIEAWINHGGGGSTYNNITVKGSGGLVPYGIALDFDKKAFMETATTPPPSGKWGPFGPALSQGTWYYIVGIYNGANMNMYVDGVLQASTINQSGNFPGAVLPLAIGRGPIGGGTQYFDGIIDEVRISDVVRSAEWIQTSFNNQDSPSSFLIFELQEEFIPVPAMTQWGMIIFVVIAGIGAAYYIRVRSSV